MFAREIHRLSRRKKRALVKVNCAALSSSLIESELFGHEKGAFTNAHARRSGRFEVADGGTLFLDEIGEMPLEAQAKLLQVLQDGSFERLGSSKTISVDVRIIAATNRNLEEEMQHGRFRQDLFYRLNRYSITIPPLRERLDDIPLLVEHMVEKFGRNLGKEIRQIPARLIEALQAYSWPGNIRELEGVIERAVLLSPGPELRLADRLEERRHMPETTQDEISIVETTPVRQDFSKSLAEVEREYILQVLEKTNWKVQGPYGTAKILDMNPNTLRSRMKKLKIERGV